MDATQQLALGAVGALFHDLERRPRRRGGVVAADEAGLGRTVGVELRHVALIRRAGHVRRVGVGGHDRGRQRILQLGLEVDRERRRLLQVGDVRPREHGLPTWCSADRRLTRRGRGRGPHVLEAGGKNIGEADVVQRVVPRRIAGLQRVGDGFAEQHRSGRGLVQRDAGRRVCRRDGCRTQSCGEHGCGDNGSEPAHGIFSKV